ncbi:MAG: SDR family NAD(P)-dependent oxidoreductase [Candidatus Woesearchaeota archaeon]
MFDMTGKVAVISGAAGGLGEAMAIALSERGASIAVFDIKDKEGHEVVSRLKTKSKFYLLDMLNEEQIKSCIDHVAGEFGRIDILINNAGVFYPTPIDSTDKASWERMMGINVTGYFLMVKYAVPYMSEGSKIINVASVAGHHAFGGASAYNSTKGAVIQLTKSMAVEYANNGINVNAICPGAFVTPMTHTTLESEAMQNLIKSGVLLGRPGRAEEIGGLAVYLSSDEASYMTGSIITIDGGWTCHL